MKRAVFLTTLLWSATVWGNLDRSSVLSGLNNSSEHGNYSDIKNIKFFGKSIDSIAREEAQSVLNDLNNSSEHGNYSNIKNIKFFRESIDSIAKGETPKTVSFKDQLIQSMSARLSEKDDTITELEKRYNDVLQRLSEQESQNESSNRKIRSQEKRIEKQKAALEKVRSMSEKQAEAIENREKLVKELRDETAKLDQELARKNKKLKKARSVSKRQAEELRDEIAKLDQKLAKKETQLKKAKSEALRQRIKNAEQEIRDFLRAQGLPEILSVTYDKDIIPNVDVNIANFSYTYLGDNSHSKYENILTALEEAYTTAKACRGNLSSLQIEANRFMDNVLVEVKFDGVSTRVVIGDFEYTRFYSESEKDIFLSEAEFINRSLRKASKAFDKYIQKRAKEELRQRIKDAEQEIRDFLHDKGLPEVLSFTYKRTHDVVTDLADRAYIHSGKESDSKDEIILKALKVVIDDLKSKELRNELAKKDKQLKKAKSASSLNTRKRKVQLDDEIVMR